MLFLYLLLQAWLNTCKREKKRLNKIQGNVNLSG